MKRHNKPQYYTVPREDLVALIFWATIAMRDHVWGSHAQAALAAVQRGATALELRRGHLAYLEFTTKRLGILMLKALNATGRFRYKIPPE